MGFFDQQEPGGARQPKPGKRQDVFWMTVLLPAPLPHDRAGLRQYFAGPSLGSASILCEPSPSEPGANDLLFDFGEQVILGRHFDVPLPRERLMLHRMPENADLGRAYLQLIPSTVPLAGLRLALDREFPDPWGPNGPLRPLLKVVKRLLETGGRGVVLHHAFETVKPADELLAELGDLDDPRSRPFCACIEWSLTNQGLYQSFGMWPLGLPDIRVRPSGQDRRELALARDAVLYGCAVMVQENRLLQAGERLRVPHGVRIGPFGPTTPGEAGATYAVKGDLAGLELHLLESDPLPASSYRELFFEHFIEAQFGPQVEQFEPLDVPPSIPPHTLHVRENRTGGFTIISNGFGQRPQAASQADGPGARIELMTHVDQHGPPLSQALSRLGRLAHVAGAGASPWKAFDVITSEEPIFGFRHFMLAPGAQGTLPDGTPVTVLAVFPVSEEERLELLSLPGPQAVTGWLQARVNAPEKVRAMMSRWKSALEQPRP